jgi:DNA polymerase elongation subunit (family B)
MTQKDFENILFIDIETVPIAKSYKELPEVFQKLWQDKHQLFRDLPEDAEKSFESKAGIYAEFGKIICISAGFFFLDKKQRNFRVKSFSSNDEVEVLREFAELLKKNFNGLKHTICGHNVKEFDIPYLCRRMLINGIELPKILDQSGKKPWETRYIDTFQLWKFGDYKSYTSLKLLAALFNIPTPKDDIDGKDVSRVYWQENDLERIATYCQKDVLTTAQLLLRFNNLSVLEETEVTFLT